MRSPAQSPYTPVVLTYTLRNARARRVTCSLACGASPFARTRRPLVRRRAAAASQRRMRTSSLPSVAGGARCSTASAERASDAARPRLARTSRSAATGKIPASRSSFAVVSLRARPSQRARSFKPIRVVSRRATSPAPTIRILSFRFFTLFPRSFSDSLHASSHTRSRRPRIYL